MKATASPADQTIGPIADVDLLQLAAALVAIRLVLWCDRRRVRQKVKALREIAGGANRASL